MSDVDPSQTAPQQVSTSAPPSSLPTPHPSPHSTPFLSPAALADAASDSPAQDPVVVAANVHKEYHSSGHTVYALRGIDVSIGRGTFAAIMGASGSGKSTLLHLLGGLTPVTRGQILIEGQDLAVMTDRQRTIFRRRRMGIIFQDYNLLPTLSAAENVSLPLLVDGAPGSKYEQRVADMLALVHLSDRANHRPDAMSGGEQQRVAIARALLNDPAIVLADEPTGNLDSRQSLEIWRLMQRIAHERNKTIVMVTHEAAGAAFADRVFVLKDGQVVGVLEPKGSGDAALVATGYTELAG